MDLRLAGRPVASQPLPPELPAETDRRILVSRGDQARAWLEAAPALATRRAELWQLELEETIVEGFDSWVLTCRAHGGQARVLKLMPDRRAASAQIATLRTWERLGATRIARLLRADRDDGAPLLERIEPGRSGADLPAEAAAQQASAILSDLHRPLRLRPDVPQLGTRVAGALDYLQEGLGDAAETSSCTPLATELLDTVPDAPVLLHADFSLRNMLDV